MEANLNVAKVVRDFVLPVSVKESPNAYIFVKGLGFVRFWVEECVKGEMRARVRSMRWIWRERDMVGELWVNVCSEFGRLLYIYRSGEDEME